jgi:DNA polymerase-3 subunit beta
MQFETTKKALVLALSRLRDTWKTPILIEARYDGVLLTGWGSEFSIQTSISDCPKVPGSICLNGKILHDLAKSLPDENLCIQTEDFRVWVNNMILTGSSAENAPSLPDTSQVAYDVVDTGDVRELVGKTHFAMSKDESRSNLCGVHLETKSHRLVATAADGPRLSTIKRNPYLLSFPEGGVIVPRAAILALKRVLTKKDKDLQIGHRNDWAYFDLGHTQIATRLIDASYPNFSEVIPKAFELTLHVEAKSLLSTLKSVKFFSAKKPRLVQLKIRNNVAALYASDPKKGEYEETFLMSNDPLPETTRSYDWKYLEDVLKVIEGDAVIRIPKGLQPIVIQDTKDPEATYLILPIRS